MTIKYVYFTKARIIFDDLFTLKVIDSLDKIVEVANHYMHEYGFYKANINDDDTGADLVNITNS